jgi:predicted dehydrogenase
MSKITRRGFLAGSAAMLAGCATTRPRKSGMMAAAAPIRVSPNEKINIASIGAGGKGTSDIWACRNHNVVALCDVDDQRAADSFNNFPKARKFKDFRVMLDEMPEIEAVVVSTPDHTHAPAALRAMRMGKHVYVQKPLTYTVEEARLMTQVARENNVATQMGNQGHCDEGVRQTCEMIWSGAIGDITEVHCWTDRPIWDQGMTEPLPEMPVPAHLDWDLWLGPAAYTPFNPGYAHFVWRGWQEFGCGALGDMACHIMDPAYWSLHLGNPVSVECVTQEGVNDLTFPNRCVIRYEFPARVVEGKTLAPVTFYWHDGGLKPMHPHGVPKDQVLGDGDNGTLFIGTDGIMTCNTYGQDPRILPATRMADYKKPDPFIPRCPDNSSYEDWFRAIREGIPSASNFDYAGPFTETVLLGNFALKTGKRLEWDADAMKVTNCPEANRFLRRETYRDGFGLE